MAPRLDNLDEFGDPARYDREFGNFQPDSSFYITLAAEVGGPVLDLACGTGRIAIALAKPGAVIVGLDAHAGMLARAAEKSRGLPIRWVEGDMRDFVLSERFALVTMAGNAFQALLTDDDQRAMLACVQRHLKPGGRLAFDTRNPRHSDLYGNEFETHWHDYPDEDGTPIEVWAKEIYDPATEILGCTILRRRRGDQRPPRSSRIDLRYLSVVALNARLEEAGFEIERQDGDFAGGALTPDSPSIVSVCRRR